jgi:ABC-type transport system involved in multi-copper enzyme maturation permease subunit
VLYYKAWLESRVRFLAAGAVVSLYCFTFVQRARIDFPPALEPMLPYTAHVWRGIYNGLVAVVFVVMAGLLGLGGLERERETRSCAFTLTLPVSRFRLLWPRVVVAMVEMALLTAIPLVVVPWASASIGREYPVIHAIRFAVLFAITGTVWVSAGVLASIALSGAYVSLAASLLAPAICAAVFSGTALSAHPLLSPLNVMNGSRLPFLNRVTALADGPLPWAALFSCAFISAVLLGVASALAYRRDF